MHKQKGRKPRSANFNNLTSLLYDNGYNYKTICDGLNISRMHYYDYFQHPRKFTLEKLYLLSYMVQKPLPYILNIIVGFNQKSVHWFSEDSLPVDEKLELIKLKGKDK